MVVQQTTDFRQRRTKFIYSRDRLAAMLAEPFMRVDDGKAHLYLFPGEKALRTPKSGDDRLVLDGDAEDLGRTFERILGNTNNYSGFAPLKYLKVPDIVRRDLLVAAGNRFDLIATRLVEAPENAENPIVVGRVSKEDEFLAPSAEVGQSAATIALIPSGEESGVGVGDGGSEAAEPEGDGSSEAAEEEEKSDEHKADQRKRLALTLAVAAGIGLFVYKTGHSKSFAFVSAGVATVAGAYIHNKDVVPEVPAN